MGLGKYDLAIFGAEKDFSIIDDYRTSTFESVLDWHTICGTSWKFDSSPTPEELGKPLLGVTSIKLDPYASVKNSIVTLEEDIAEEIMKTGKGVYCSLGNYELVCIVGGDSFCQLSEGIEEIKQVLIRHKPIPILDITTIPCFDPSILAQEEFEKIAQAELSYELIVSAKLGSHKTLLKMLHKLCDEPLVSNIFGFHDVVVHCTGSFRNFIQGVLDLRTNAKDVGIYSTVTAIGRSGVQGSEYEQTSKTHPSKSSNLMLSRKGALAHFQHLLNISVSDPLVKTNFRNHRGLFDNIKRLTDRYTRSKQSRKMAEYSRDLERYDTVLDCLRLVFSQRYAGLWPGNLLGYKELGLEPHGGIQRVLLAIEAIPISLLKLFHIDWDGLCFCGYSHRFYRTDCGLINIPEAFRVQPEKWWQIYHEIGHEAFERLKDKNFRDWVKTQIDSLAKIAYDNAREENMDASKKKIIFDFTEFADELFADVFSFRFGFRKDWKLYRDRVWTFLAEESPITPNHIASSILVYFSLGPGYEERIARDGPTGPELIRERIEKLSEFFIGKGRKKWTKKLKESASIRVAFFSSISDKFADYLDKFKIDPITTSQVNAINTDLETGKIVKAKDPNDLVFALTSYGKKLSTKNRVTAIISLYEAYWRLLLNL